MITSSVLPCKKTLTTNVSGKWSRRSEVNVSYDWLRRRAEPRRRLTRLVDINDDVINTHRQWSLWGFKKKTFPLLKSAWHLQRFGSMDRKKDDKERKGSEEGEGTEKKAKSKRGAQSRERTAFVCLSVFVCCGWHTHFHCCFPQMLPHRAGEEEGWSCTLAPHTHTNTHTQVQQHVGFC